MPTDLSPRSAASAMVLPPTGASTPWQGEQLKSACPFGIYTGSIGFISGASTQVAYVYKKLGGDIVDIELTVDNVYAAYEEAVLEYSYIINLHQSKNSLSNMLGQPTGTFNHKGENTTPNLTGSGTPPISLRYPRFQYSNAKRIGDGLAQIGGFGGTVRQYSASFIPTADQQDYNLQHIIENASVTGIDESGSPVDFIGKVSDSERIIITKVFFKTPRAMWRFYGYYGGVGVVGNYSTYGQFSDDSTFEIIPTWQNKLQAIMYEDSIVTRTSNFAYEIMDNRLRLYPNPSTWSQQLDRIWFRFYVDSASWEESEGYHDGTLGVNNMNTLPFENLPYDSINSMGKQWIRKYALALCKEMLGQIRGKFTTIPIPGESVTLNFSDLLSQAKEEQTTLRDRLTETLKEMEYSELIKKDKDTAEAAASTLNYSPLPIFVG